MGHRLEVLQICSTATGAVVGIGQFQFVGREQMFFAASDSSSTCRLHSQSSSLGIERLDAALFLHPHEKIVRRYKYQKDNAVVFPVNANENELDVLIGS